MFAGKRSAERVLSCYLIKATLGVVYMFTRNAYSASLQLVLRITRIISMANKPSKYLPAQSNNSNTTKNVLNTAKVNNKKARKTSMTSFWFLHC